jgi:2',3'-cyclic-nucleotide 2'-phosphodiesterase (5'-nucleotidase family)
MKLPNTDLSQVSESFAPKLASAAKATPQADAVRPQSRLSTADSAAPARTARADAKGAEDLVKARKRLQDGEDLGEVETSGLTSDNLAAQSDEQALDLEHMPAGMSDSSAAALIDSSYAQPSTLLAQAGSSAAGSAGTSSGAASAAGAASGTVIGSSGMLAALAAIGGVAAIHNANSSSSSTASRPTAAGTVIDGYISGATVFIDVNGNGQLDAGEPSTTTDAQGNFSLPADVTGTLIAFGGTDVSTGLEFKGALKAPAGATVVTPLTTLVSDLVTAGASLAEAKTAVFSALGQSALSSSVDLLKFDPVKATQSTDSASRTAGLELQKGAVLVSNMVADAVTKIQQASGAGNDSRDDIARDVFSTLAGQLRSSASNKLTTGVGTVAEGLMTNLAAKTSIGGVSAAALQAVQADLLADKSAFASTHTGFRDAIKDLSSVSNVANVQRDSQSAPRLLNASVDGLGDVITLYFDSTLDTSKLPATTQFTVRNGGSDASPVNLSVSSLQVVNNQVLLKLAAPVNAGQAVQVSFADDAKTNDVNTVQDKGGVDARSFSGVTVGNRLSLTPSLSENFTQAATVTLAGAEISAFDPGSKRLFVTSSAGLQVVSVDAELKMTLLGTVSLGSNDINSVAVKNGMVAVAVAASDKTQPGEVYFLNAGAQLSITGTGASSVIAQTGLVQGKVNVGALPDMLTFTADGKMVLVANEAEQNDVDGNNPPPLVNPEGSVSIINLSAGAASATVTTASFSAFNSKAAELKAKGVRLMAGEAGFESVTVAQDLEPEYIAISLDGKTAFVTLQENNAIAILDIASGKFTDIVPLGLKSFMGLPFDGSDRDGTSNSNAINLQTTRPVFGQYMPDAIASFRGADGRTYYAIANEGDDRDDFIVPNETASVSALNLDAAAFPNATALKANDGIGRLTASNAPGNKGDTDGDGDIDRILSYGARSFSILNDQGVIVFDSGSHIEQFFAAGGVFSGANSSGLFDDSRSDNKGPEPEGVTVGQVGDKTLAFVGLERGGGGVMVYDVTHPGQVSFVQYLRNPADVSPEGLTFVAAKDSPSGRDALFVTNEVSNSVTVFKDTPYTLQLLHFADAEAGLLASSTAPKLAALVDKFEDAYANSITLAGGDNFIPGPFMAAGTDPSLLNLLGVPGNRGNIEIGALDIAIHNKIGVSASGLGNHEFDLGSNALAAAFRPGTGSPGADFVYVSANLDFSADSALNPHFVNTVATAGLEEASSLKGKIAPSAIITKGGEKIGLVGATTQILESISSPSGTKVRDNDSVRSDDMDLLATQLQPVINDLIAQGVNKIILMSHLQVLANEKLLATKLQGVDIILAAGSNTRLGDANDTAVAFAGHAANFADTYPLVIKDKDGKNTLVVNTDNEFTYLGRLVVDFDGAGQIRLDSLAANSAINGAYASTDANVAAAWGTSAQQLATTAYASGTRGGQVKALTDAVQSVITAKDGNVYGYSNVYLEGERIAVRNQETNLGNISADANAYALKQALGSAAAQTYIVSIKNGGGIRAQIGTLSAPKADGTVDKLPPDGGVSQLDVENSLRFNNQLMAFDTTPAGLKAILEHGVAILGSQGRFPQLGGVAFSYDPDFAAGSRVNDIALVGEGYRVNLYNDGALLPGAPEKFTVVTLNFLANGGDSYPMKANGENFRYVVQKPDGSLALTSPVDEALIFTATDTIAAAVGSNSLLGEQTALEAYMKAFHNTQAKAYNLAETAEAQDTRIQNLNVRTEDVLTQLGMSQVGTFATNAYDAGGAEIVAFDAGSKRMFLVNAVAAEIQVVSLADPANPVLVGKLDLKGYATTTGSTPQVNSVASAGGVVAVALADADPTKAGKLVLFKADLAVSTTAAAPAGARALDAGVGPDMVTFTPDGKRVLVANEAESINERASTDPFYNAGAPFVANGGITVVTLGAEAASAIANATVQQLDFSAYNGKEGMLRERGVRIAAGTTAANDLEPEYIAVSPDGKQAMVTLQENNAVAVLNLNGATASIVDIVALGYKNHARGDLVMAAYDTLSPTELGTIGIDAFGNAVPAGGFSGLHYTGQANGKWRFLAVSDRGPNGEPVNVDGDAALERPFVLPNYQARVSTLEFDPASKQISIVSTTLLTRADGTPLTGLPNIPGTDEEPVQIVPASDPNKTGTFTSGSTTLGYKTLAYDTLGADLEGVYQTASGSMWMVDEYRPAVYEFDAAGKMVARFVPTGTAALTADPNDNFGTETLPTHLIKRQANRGFEALAVDEAKGLLFAFVQSPLDSVSGSTVDTAGPLVRIEVMAMRDLDAGTALPQGGTLAAAASKGTVIAEYAYLLDRPALRFNSQIDKIGDAAFNPATGTIFVFERDNEIVPEGKKMLFEIDLRGATNLLTATPTLPAGKTALEALTVDELLAAGINPVYKEMLANLPTLGFLPNDKAEGLALLPNGGLAVINDNDFGVNGAGTETVGFGVLNFNGANRIDADNDTTGQPSGTIAAVNVAKTGLYGAYMPDGIAAFSAKGKNYYITANEGDSRGVDEVSVKDLGKTGKPAADASAKASALDGDLKVLANGIDVDGDGDLDKMVAFGGRSFTILDAYGNRVFDSGDQIERLIAEVLPAHFNASHTNNSLDNRSDDKGPEPEGVTTAVIDDKVYAFLGLERIGGVAVYDISNPYQPNFVSYSNNRDFSKSPALGVGGDLGPEGLMVIPASASPSGKPMVVVANEISGTVTLFNAQQTSMTETDPKLWLGEQLSNSDLFSLGAVDSNFMLANNSVFGI